MLSNQFASLTQWLGIQSNANSTEKLLSTFGGFVSLSLIVAVSIAITGSEGAVAVVPAMGAATVLLFAAPHGPLSQPWALFAGNIISAFIGVTVTLLIPDVAVAAGVAVGLAIGVMHICRCIHPPGGATALAAVIGGDSIHALGYSYIFAPVLLNCLIIFVIALVFNNLFGWRRYPLASMRISKQPPATKITKGINQQHIKAAQISLNMQLDMNPTQLLNLFQKAQAIKDQEQIDQLQLERGGVYSNNQPGRSWSVRKIIDFSLHDNPSHNLVIYRVIDGADQHQCDSCTLADFASWAKIKVKAAQS